MCNHSLTTADTGLGTTYERWALMRAQHLLLHHLPIHDVLEGPGDGMTGICGLNSLPLGLSGATVTLWLPEQKDAATFARQVWQKHAPRARLQVDTTTPYHPFPFPEASFDLVWNFNIMPRLTRPLETLREMARCSRRFVLIFVPNRRNYGFPLHRLHHRITHQPWDHGDIGLMHPAAWRPLFTQTNLRILRTFHVDCPWWPDIVNPAELLADFIPPLRGRLNKAESPRRAAVVF